MTTKRILAGLIVYALIVVDILTVLAPISVTFLSISVGIPLPIAWLLAIGFYVFLPKLIVKAFKLLNGRLDE